MAAADGSAPTIVLEGDARYPFAYSPAWSPDGTALALRRSSGGVAGEIWVVPLDRGEPRRVSSAEPGIFYHEPVFAVDGRSIICVSNRGGASNLWSLPLAPGEPRRLTSGPGDQSHPSTARNGSVVFASSSGRNVVLRHVPESGETVELATHNGLLWAPQVSPDGSTVAFSRSGQGGQWHLWLVSAEGGPARQLTSGSDGKIYPRFMPDGKALLYYSWERPRTIFRVALNSGSTTRLTPTNEDDSLPAISPDGRWLAFVRENEAIARVFLMELDAGGRVVDSPARPLTLGPSTVPSWSPDSEWIVYSVDRGRQSGVYRARWNGTDGSRLSAAGGWPVWHPSGTEIVYQALGVDGALQLRAVPAEGGLDRPFGSLQFKGTNFPLGFAPDGSFLVVGNVRHFNSEIWLLEPKRP